MDFGRGFSYQGSGLAEIMAAKFGHICSGLQIALIYMPRYYVCPVPDVVIAGSWSFASLGCSCQTPQFAGCEIWLSALE